MKLFLFKVNNFLKDLDKFQSCIQKKDFLFKDNFFELNFATFIELIFLSVPIPTALGNSFKIDNKIHPDPVPKSKTEIDELVLYFFLTTDIISSVSGRGIRVCLFTLKFKPQNSLNPTK